MAALGIKEDWLVGLLGQSRLSRFFQIWVLPEYAPRGAYCFV